QMVFQDPLSSMDPRRKVGDSVGEPMLARGEKPTRQRIAEVMDAVGLSDRHAGRFPHELSGGQLQRASIARTLVADARLVVHDESVSALDVSLQSQILNLLQDLQREFGFSYLFISHDIAAVQAISDEVAVMYLGKIVERSAVAAFLSSPLHPYSVALRS